MALVGFAPKQEYLGNPSRFEVLRVTDGPNREWFLDTGHLATAGVTVLDTYTDGPIIKALDEYDGFMRVSPTEPRRTLPATLEEMNQQQLLATSEGHAVEGGPDLSRSKLRQEMAKVRKSDESDTEDAVYAPDAEVESVGPSPATNPDIKHDATLGGAATGTSTDDSGDGPTVDTIKGSGKKGSK